MGLQPVFFNEKFNENEFDAKSTGLSPELFELTTLVKCIGQFVTDYSEYSYGGIDTIKKALHQLYSLKNETRNKYINFLLLGLNTENVKIPTLYSRFSTSWSVKDIDLIPLLQEGIRDFIISLDIYNLEPEFKTHAENANLVDKFSKIPLNHKQPGGKIRKSRARKSRKGNKKSRKSRRR